MLLASLSLLVGCRDLVLPPGATEADVVAAAEFAPDDLRARVLPVGTPPQVCDEPANPSLTAPAGIRVVDAAGRPVEGAPVGHRVEEGDWTEDARTGPDGLARVVVPAGAEVTVLGIPSKPGSACPVRAQRPEELPAEEPGVHWSGAVSQEAVFQVAEVCPVLLRVLGAEGAPVAGATLLYAPASAKRFVTPQEIAGATDDDGRLDAVVPCGPTLFAADVPDGPRVALDAVGVTADAEIVVETPEAWVEVAGVARSPSGAPVSGVEVTLRPFGGRRFDLDRHVDADDLREATAETDAEGRYTARVAPGTDALASWMASAEREGEGLGSANMLLRPGQAAAYDPVADAGRWVDVRCAGLPDESCLDVGTVDCEAPGTLRSGDRAGEDVTVVHVGDRAVRHTRTRCPLGEAVVHAGDVAVRVASDEDVAWLDYRAVSGGVTGRVERAGGRCSAMASRPMAGVLLLGQASDMRGGDVAADGTFRVDHLSPGAWEVSVSCSTREAGTRVRREATARAEVADGVVDVGALALVEEER